MMMSAQYDIFLKKSHDIFVSPKYCTSWLVIPKKNNECEFFHNFQWGDVWIIIGP